MSSLLPEPGEIEDPDHGLPGSAEELPKDDADQDEPTEVNDDEQYTEVEE